MDTQIAEGQAAIAGLGVAILNPMLWVAEMAARRLVTAIDALAFDPNDFWLVYPEHHRQARKIRLFRQWLLEAVAQDAARGVADYYRQPALGQAAQD